MFLGGRKDKYFCLWFMLLIFWFPNRKYIKIFYIFFRKLKYVGL